MRRASEPGGEPVMKRSQGETAPACAPTGNRTPEGSAADALRAFLRMLAREVVRRLKQEQSNQKPSKLQPRDGREVRKARPATLGGRAHGQ